MDIKEQLEAIKNELKSQTDTAIKEGLEKKAAELQAKLEAAETKAQEAETKAAGYESRVAKLESDAKVTQDAYDKLEVKIKRVPTTYEKSETKSFNDYVAETIERNKDDIQSNGSRKIVNGNSRTLSYDMFTPEEQKAFTEKTKDGKIETKAVGNMTLAANFPGAATLYQDFRGPLIEQPQNQTWISDILPTSASSGTQVVYPKENGLGEGGAAPWTDHTVDKAQIDFDLVATTAKFEWLAGYVIIEREMLDDIPFMTQFIQSRMLISLKKAENGLILNGTPNVPGFQQVASPYNGNLLTAVDRSIDAAMGQIPDQTSDYYMGTDIIVRRRDLTQKFILNKASGSGEYNLPESQGQGLVRYTANGQVAIANLNVTGTTDVALNTFYAIDKNATAFIRRMQPELRLFEDSTLAKQNKLMWRIEERATLVIFNNAAIVKGVLASS